MCIYAYKWCPLSMWMVKFLSLVYEVFCYHLLFKSCVLKWHLSHFWVSSLPLSSLVSILTGDSNFNWASLFLSLFLFSNPVVLQESEIPDWRLTQKFSWSNWSSTSLILFQFHISEIYKLVNIYVLVCKTPAPTSKLAIIGSFREDFSGASQVGLVGCIASCNDPKTALS